MQEHEKNLVWLLLIGAAIAIGRVLNSDEPITPRLFIARVVLGSATSVAAGAVLILIPGLPVLAVTGLGAALGITGHQAVELWLRRKGSRWLSARGRHDIE
ncbi:phage holin family protein [Candidatus Sodalis sp. SoCistrobi]|uniref:phage holin family protein n=1 Tax=Candidatus Sodalis sp. SoCistrobi TaxID=1922216 RepID=UPI00093EA2A5|nr:phage holin family protein [Candidatus Sodalis sp. SoCistrobi]